MRTSTTCFAMCLLAACGSSHDAASPSIRNGPLDESERQAARQVPTYADVVASIDGDVDRPYAGSAVLQVSTGSVAGTLLVVTAVAEAPTQSLGGHIRIPPEIAGTLSTVGWDFTLAASDLGPEDGIVGDELSGAIETVSIRADPDGLFNAHVMIDDGGTTREVDLTGRLTGGCSVIDDEGGVTLVADATSVPECNGVLSAL